MEKLAIKDLVEKKIGKSHREFIKIKGWFQINHIRDGIVIDSRNILNTVTNAGFACCQRRFQLFRWVGDLVFPLAYALINLL